MPSRSCISNQYTMKHLLLLFALTLSVLQFLSAQQQFQGSGFEVHTRLKHPKSGNVLRLNKDSLMARISAIPDTATQYATFVCTTNNTNVVDSLELSLTDSRGITVYAGSFSKSQLIASGALRIVGQTIYVDAGSFPYLKNFGARLRFTTGGGVKGSWLEFSK